MKKATSLDLVHFDTVAMKIKKKFTDGKSKLNVLKRYKSKF